MSEAPAALQATPVPAAMNTFLAIDFGMKRTGVAVGNRLLRTAQPVGSVKAEGDARFALIEKLPVFEVDERYSTTEALASGAKDADAASACIILEQFLRSLP